MHTSTANIQSQRDAVERDIRYLEEQLAARKATLERLQRPSIGSHFLDPYGNGKVLRITKKFGKTDRAQTYTYAAVKANGQWHLTGSTTPFGDHEPMSWSELAEFCQGASVEGMTSTARLQLADAD